MEKQDYDFIDPVQNQWFQSCNPEDFAHSECLYRYLKQIVPSEGFDIDEDPESDVFNAIRPWSIDDRVLDAANFAVQEFNRLKGAELKFRKVIKANGTIVSGILYYITLECWDGRFYEAKVYQPFGEDHTLDIFRLAKHYPISTGSNSTKSEGSSVDSDAN